MSFYRCYPLSAERCKRIFKIVLIKLFTVESERAQSTRQSYVRCSFILHTFVLEISPHFASMTTHHFAVILGNGGGWGYSVHSTEAIRFMTDTDIVLGGVGVFGGRGEYSVTVGVYEDDGETENVSDAEPLVETDRIPYECGFR